MVIDLSQFPNVVGYLKFDEPTMDDVLSENDHFSKDVFDIWHTGTHIPLVLVNIHYPG
jgi:hypothetical protein|uniref:Uncharacterized protein n=1 Tax=viral metagenome TaxID=1070528 RepID=A0A6C0IVS4_9ZZZZ